MARASFTVERQIAPSAETIAGLIVSPEEEPMTKGLKSWAPLVVEAHRESRGQQPIDAARARRQLGRP